MFLPSCLEAWEGGSSREAVCQDKGRRSREKRRTMRFHAYSVVAGLLLSGLHFINCDTNATTPATTAGAMWIRDVMSENTTALRSLVGSANTTLATGGTSSPGSATNATSTPGPTSHPVAPSAGPATLSPASNDTTATPTTTSMATVRSARNVTAAPVDAGTQWPPGANTSAPNPASPMTALPAKTSPASNMTGSTLNLTSTPSSNKVETSAGPEGEVNAPAKTAGTTSGPGGNATRAPPSLANTTTTTTTTTSAPLAETSRNGVTVFSAPPFLAFALLAVSALCLQN